MRKVPIMNFWLLYEHAHMCMHVLKESMSWAKRSWVQSLALNDSGDVWDWSQLTELSSRCLSCPPKPSTMTSAQVLVTNIPGEHPDHIWHLDKG